MLDTSLMLKVGIYRYASGSPKNSAVLVKEQYILLPKIKSSFSDYDGNYTIENINISDYITKVKIVDVPPTTGVWHYIIGYSWGISRPPLSITSYTQYAGISDYSIFVKEVEIEAG
jgi:hypothetical protein